jgi:hypothetical protein
MGGGVAFFCRVFHFTFSFVGTGLIAGFHEEGVHQNENDLPRRIAEGSRLKKGRFSALC